MTRSERSEFLKSREGAIGGSDIGSLMSNQIDVEYGCERNLWAKLSGIPTDNPDVESMPILMGNVLEPFIRRAYSDVTGRVVVQHGLKKHATVFGLQYHDDGIIFPAPTDKRATNGVLEAKGIGREMMAKVSENGLPQDYMLQVQGGTAAHDLEWGAFAVGVRDEMLPLVAIEQAATLAGEQMPKLPYRPKIVHFEVERSPEIVKAIEEYVPKFLATVGEDGKAPRRLDPEDPRCGRCPRKIWCQGSALMASVTEEENKNKAPRRPDLIPLADEYRANMALLESCISLVEQTEQKFKDALGPLQAISLPVGSDWKNVIYRIRSGAIKVDGRSMAVTYDQLRRAAIEANLPGAELTPPSGEFERKGAPSRPLLLKSLLPKKPKKKGEVPEVDEAEGEE